MVVNANHHIWRTWANNLQRWGVSELAAELLEVAGPMAFLSSQVVYLGQPLLHGLMPEEELQALTTLLEDGSQTQAFAKYLREEMPL